MYNSKNNIKYYRKHEIKDHEVGAAKLGDCEAGSKNEDGGHNNE
jgi:hypothetical protein